MASFGYAIYIFIYVLQTIYFVVLSCFMLFRQSGADCGRGDRKAKQHMTRTMGIAMGVWALDYLIYLLPMLCGIDGLHPVNMLCTLVTLMLVTPIVYLVMYAIVQKDVSTRHCLIRVGTPFLLPIAWFLCLPEGADVSLPVHAASALCIACLIWLLVRYTGEYRRYVRRLRSEYSDISGRDLIWTWSCFSGFILQLLLFIAYQIFWMPFLAPIYGIISFVNAAYLCYCTCRQIPLDNTVPDEEPLPEAAPEGRNEPKAYYEVIEQRLESICKEKQLFTDPDLTLVSLAQSLSVSRTYIGTYLRSRGVTFYQYINTLRVNHAVELMEAHPGMSIREVSEQSGFRSQTTFRKMFQQVTGHLPSEVKARMPEHPAAS